MWALGLHQVFGPKMRHGDSTIKPTMEASHQLILALVGDEVGFMTNKTVSPGRGTA